MRNGWTETTLGDIAEVVGGGTPSTSKEEFWDGDVVWLTPTEVTAIDGKVISDSKRKITQAGLRSSGARVLPKGTVILTSRASVGFVALAGTELTTNQGFQSLIPSGLVDGVFLMFWIQMNRAEFESRSAGSTFKEISKSNVKSIAMNLPPLEEQKRIVDVVSSVDTYIDSLQQQADLVRTARNAVLHELLSAGGDDWTETTLGDLTSTTRPICYGVLKPGPFVDGGVPLVRITDMDRPLLGPEGMHRISSELDDEFKRSRLRGNEVLLSIQGTVGRVARCGPELAGANISRTIALIDCDERLLNEFLAIYLESMATNNAFNSSGSTRDSLNISEIRLINVPVPPLEEQKRIVDVVSSMDDVIQATERAIVDAKNLRSGILSDLLSGEHEIPASYDKFLGAA
jgi:type I restriction enzyme S subunit